MPQRCGIYFFFQSKKGEICAIGKYPSIIGVESFYIPVGGISWKLNNDKVEEDFQTKQIYL